MNNKRGQASPRVWKVFHLLGEQRFDVGLQARATAWVVAGKAEDDRTGAGAGHSIEVPDSWYGGVGLG